MLVQKNNGNAYEKAQQNSWELRSVSDFRMPLRRILDGDYLGGHHDLGSRSLPTVSQQADDTNTHQGARLGDGLDLLDVGVTQVR